MILYSQTDLETVPFPIKQFTVSVGMDGFSILNMSNIPLSLSSATVGSLGDVPPLFSRSILASAGDVISVSEASFTTSAIAQPSQFVELTQSTGTVPALVPLAVVPGYQLTVTGNVTANLPGGTTVNIGNTPAVTINSGTVNIGTMPSVTIASGTINVATVQSITDVVQNQVVNERLSINDLIEIGVASTAINLAAGASMNLTMPTLSKAVQFDQVYLFVSSSNQQIPHYSFQLTSVELNDVGWEGSTNGQSYPLTFTAGSANNSIMMTWPLNVSPQIGSSANISITNNYTSSISGDTITATVWVRLAAANVTNPSTAPIPTQAQYATTQYNLGSYTFASTSIPANSQGASQFTGSVNVTNAKRLQFLIQQTASSGFSGTGTSGTSAWGVSFQLQGSEDNSTWYAIAGGPVSPSSVSIVTDGAINVAIDTAAMPQMGAGYPYIRWALQLFNGNTTTAETLSESCTLALLVQE